MEERIMVIDCQRDVDFENAVNDLDKIIYIVFDEAEDFYTCDTLTQAEQLCKKVNGTIYFYHIDMVERIIADLDEELWDKLDTAEYERFDLDRGTSNNAKKRLARYLAKIGITETDWNLWCTL